MHWSQKEIRKPDRPTVEWIELGELGEPPIVIGAIRDGSWVVDTADGLIDLSNKDALTFAFPILKSSLIDVQSFVDKYCSQIDSFNQKDLPLSRVVEHAISSGGYWAEMAMPWLLEEMFDETFNSSVIESLRKLESNKVYSQKLRHQAAAYRRKIEKGIC